ncbi:MAG TPA: SIS domain-containing protein [Candidatus Dormibacteraeota bacterium]|nr:SIS domain-containing protein [Candidatus Dormibacteraeota bacterium]
MTASGPSESGTKALFAGALDEIRGVLESGAAAEVDKLCDELLKAHRIACYGVGREGLMMRALSMRLMHLGLDAHVVGDMTTPPLREGDLLVVSAGPGSFSTVKALQGVAHLAGARTAALTAQPGGEVPSAADTVIILRAQTMADDKGGRSVLPMGSLYEAAMLIFFDIVSIVLRGRTGQTMEGMRGRHTNLE